MATKIYLRVLDEDESPLDMQPPWIMPRGASNVIAEFRNEGNDVWSLDLNPTIDGDVQLVLRIADHPALPFSMVANDGAESPFTFGKQVPRCASLTQQLITRGADQSTAIVALQFNLAKKHEEVILVAGVDLKGHTDYMRFAKTYRDDLYAGTTRFGGSERPIHRVIRNHTVVTTFDFATGYRRRQVKAQDGWHELDSVLMGAKPPYIENGETVEAQQRRHAENTISIVHVYAHIAGLGDEARGSLREMHYFSHAWIEGPILLNTNEETKYQSSCKGIRDPNDKDARCKDFCEENISNFQGFCRAFAKSAFVKVWGCFRHNVHDHVDAVAELEDPEEMRPVDGLPFNSREVAERVRREAIAVSYLGNLIRKVGIEGVGTVPTTTSNYQRVGRKYYMFINRDVHGEHLGWFERNFNVQTDEWGYVDYRALL
jgi:hypothetical protein